MSEQNEKPGQCYIDSYCNSFLITGVTYQQLKSKSLKKGDLYEDPDFPCDDSSLYFSEKPVSGNVEWKRPHVSDRLPLLYTLVFTVIPGYLGQLIFNFVD